MAIGGVKMAAVVPARVSRPRPGGHHSRSAPALVNDAQEANS